MCLATREAAVQRDRATLVIIQDALGTAETGDDLVSVARNAHRAEQELTAVYRRMESFLVRGGGAYRLVAADLPTLDVHFATRTHAEVYALLHGIKRFDIVDAGTGKPVKEQRLSGFQTHRAFVKMKEIGDSFAQALADTYFKAPPDEKVRIYNTWTDKVRKYHLIATATDQKDTTHE